MNKKLVLSVISAIYLILLLLGAFVVKLGTAGENGVGFDKVLHFFGFFILAVLLLLTFKYYRLSNRFASVFLIALGIGILIESVQIGIPGRDFELLDILADVLGIIFGSVLVWSFSKR